MEPAMMQNTKKLLNNFKEIRRDLKSADGQAKRHVQAWVSNVSQLNTDLQGQYGQLKNVSVNDSAGAAGGDMSMKQDSFQNLFEKLQLEINQMIDQNASLCLALPKIRGQNTYKLSEEDTKMLWKKESSQLKQLMNEMLNTGNQMTVEDKFQCIAKLLQIKDNLQQQLFQGISYQKLVTWDDLNIKLAGAGVEQDSVIYADSKVVELTKKISHFMETQKFLPRQLAWEPFNFNDPSANGKSLFSPDWERGQYDCVETITCLYKQFQDMLDVIKTSFLFSDEKKEQFRKNNAQQQTLRQELEDLNMEFQEYREQYRKLQEQLSKTDAQMNQSDETSARLKELDHKCIQLQEELEQHKNQSKDFQSKWLDLKRKHKQLDDQHTKMKNSVIPKVNQTKEYQKDLVEQICKIREDSAMLPDMFRQLVKDSQELEKSKNEAIKSKDKALQSDTHLRRQVKNLTDDLERKKRLAVTAIAARSGIQDQLSSSQQAISNLNNQHSDMVERYQEAQAEKDRYAFKHDEMFASVGNLNARIEELEQHKLHLLEKLKKYGDKGGLEYIIKTQKLEGIRGKEQSKYSGEGLGSGADSGSRGNLKKKSSHVTGLGETSPNSQENKASNKDQGSVSGNDVSADK